LTEFIKNDTDDSSPIWFHAFELISEVRGNQDSKISYTLKYWSIHLKGQLEIFSWKWARRTCICLDSVTAGMVLVRMVWIFVPCNH